MSHPSVPMRRIFQTMLVTIMPLTMLAQSKESAMEQPVYYRTVKVDGLPRSWAQGSTDDSIAPWSSVVFAHV
jgi:hypothetical protein